MDIEVDSQEYVTNISVLHNHPTHHSINQNNHSVIKIMLQFLKENNLHNTMKTLQQETNISLNVVDDLDKLLSDIHNGKWNTVLETVSSIGISSEVLFDLFEQIFFELIEINEIDAARSLLYTSEPLISMKSDEIHNIRYSRLEQILLNTVNNNFNISQLYGYGYNKLQKRKQISEQISKEIFEVSPSRLLSLISDALKYQQLSGKLIKGENYDLFKDYENDNKIVIDRNEKIIRKNTIIIPFSKHSIMTYITFSIDGNLLISGSSDGFIEIWDYDKGQLIKDSNIISYQNNDELLLHTENVAIRYINFSNDSQLMASGNDLGSIKIWKIYKGINVVTFESAHSKCITSLCFNKNNTQILSSSIDNSIKIHGLKSKKILKQFNGHKSFVNKCLYCNNDENIVSCSADGCIKIWDTKTTNCIYDINNINKMILTNNIENPMKEYLNKQYANKDDDNNKKVSNNNISIRNIISNNMNKKSKQEEIYVILSSDSYVVYLLNVKTGKLIRKIESEKLKRYIENKQSNNSNKNNINECDDCYFSDIVLSAYGKYLYVLGEPDHILYCFDMLKKKK
eukprot:285120_1